MQLLVLFYAFAIGVSFSATFVTLAYIAWKYDKRKTKYKISQTVLDIVIRMGYGVANVVNVLLGNTLWSAALTGFVFGGLFAVGSHQLELPRELFGAEDKKTEWKFHIAIPLLTTFVFVILIRALNTRFVFL